MLANSDSNCSDIHLISRPGDLCIPLNSQICYLYKVHVAVGLDDREKSALMMIEYIQYKYHTCYPQIMY